MADRSPVRFRGHWDLVVAGAGMVFGLAQFVGTLPAGASTTTATSSQPTVQVASAASTARLTLDQWKQRYEHDIGILADDVLVVVDDGKRAQAT